MGSGLLRLTIGALYTAALRSRERSNDVIDDTCDVSVEA